MKIILQKVADTIVQETDSLTKLDAECGDGDFGIGMNIGFRNAKNSIERYEGKDIGSLLENVGHAILSSVGGASGPIFGTIFIAMGSEVKGKNEIDLQDLSAALGAALEKVQVRGGAKVGDKTLIDALEPAVMVIQNALKEGLTLSEALEKATQAAKIGAESTKDLVAKKGKASYLGDKTIGHQDPGAVLVYHIFRSISNCMGIFQTPALK